jgi:hypothetical protein
LLVAGFGAWLFSIGGGPAGVVEGPKLKVLVGAGVVDPAGAEVEALFAEGDPKTLGVAGVFRLPNIPPLGAGAGLFSLFAGVDAPLSSFFCCPKLKPLPDPKGVLDAFAVEKIPPDTLEVFVVVADFPNIPPTAGGFPVLPPKREGVEAPEPGFEPGLFPKIDGCAPPAVAPPPNSAAGAGFVVVVDD